MKARVHVFYKDSVFDPQGNTLQQSLNRMGFNEVKEVRVGKVIDLALGEISEDQAVRDIRKMCEKLLSNPVIEAYSYELLPVKNAG